MCFFDFLPLEAACIPWLLVPPSLSSELTMMAESSFLHHISLALLLPSSSIYKDFCNEMKLKCLKMDTLLISRPADEQSSFHLWL